MREDKGRRPPRSLRDEVGASCDTRAAPENGRRHVLRSAGDKCRRDPRAPREDGERNKQPSCPSRANGETRTFVPGSVLTKERSGLLLHTPRGSSRSPQRLCAVQSHPCNALQVTESQGRRADWWLVPRGQEGVGVSVRSSWGQRCLLPGLARHRVPAVV